MNRKTLEDYFAQENPRYEEAARFPTENKRDFTEIPTFLDVKPTPLEHVDDAFLLKDDPNQEAGLSTLSQEDIKNAEAQLNASSASSGSSSASAASASSGGGLASLVSGGATVATIGVVGAVVAEVVAAAFAVLVPKLLNIDYFATDSSVSYRCVFEEYQETAEYAVRVYNEAIQGQDFQKPLQFVQSNVADVYFDGLMPSTAYTLNVMGREKDSSTEWTVFNDYTVSFTTDAPPRVLISPTIENIEMAPRVDGFYWYGHFTSYEQDVEYGLHIHNENEERYYPFVLRDGPYVNEEFLGLTPDTEYQLDIVGREQGTLEWTTFPTYALNGKTHYLPD
ncbi:MAG: hypothetical protein HUJ60_06105, partial [Bacilli bacterium]|nr:hypothetical protein [Bacilli bacterium]